MSKTLIKGATIVNEGNATKSDLLIAGDRIEKIAPSIADKNATELNATGLHLLPGVIDDQVHFREPGLTNKAEIETESKAAVAGGITSYMEMPNTLPQTLTQELLEEKYARAAAASYANYSFYMGASNDNLEEVLKTDAKSVCGVKVFMGASTGNMLVDNHETLEALFKEVPLLIATHCEKEGIIKKNYAEYHKRFGDAIPIKYHPEIRSREACLASSSEAVELARKHGTRLHVLHISTKEELELFKSDLALKEKKITAEACIHHLWFTADSYEQKGTLIKWNPAVKLQDDRDAIREALRNNIIDVIATDHAPHTREEKKQPYAKAPSGGPLVQHALPAMLDLVNNGTFSLALLTEKMSHAPARLFRIKDRGFIREGYKADLVLADLSSSWQVESDNILYKCGWSPFEGHTFSAQVLSTFVNGQKVFDRGVFQTERSAERLSFRT